MIRYWFFVFLLVACSDNKKQGCDYDGVDYIFLAHYQNCLTIINEYRTGNEKITSEYFSMSLTCLRALTGIKDNVYRGDSMGYVSEEDYYKDLKAWSHWYAENIHGFSFDDAFKKFEDYRKTNEEEVTWPPIMIDAMIH